MAKEKVKIDIFTDEASGDQIFFLVPAATPAKVIMPDCCTDSGIFTDEDDLNAFLEEHAGQMEIVEDFRGEI